MSRRLSPEKRRNCPNTRQSLAHRLNDNPGVFSRVKTENSADRARGFNDGACSPPVRYGQPSTASSEHSLAWENQCDERETLGFVQDQEAKSNQHIGCDAVSVASERSGESWAMRDPTRGRASEAGHCCEHDRNRSHVMTGANCKCRLWKSRKAENAFQLSHNLDHYEFPNRYEIRILRARSIRILRARSKGHKLLL